MTTSTYGSRMTVVGAFLLCLAGMAHADNPPTDKYADTIALFKHAGKGNQFFRRSYAYAVFPTVGEAGFIVGAALGTGRVYVHDRPVGESEMIQVSGGFQAGAKAFSQMIFFEDKRALDEFESGNFEFGADASVTAITASAGVTAGTSGAEAGASGGKVPLPFPSQAAAFKRTARALSAGWTLRAYSLASWPWGKRTRRHSTPRAIRRSATFAAPRSPASSRSKAIRTRSVFAMISASRSSSVNPSTP